MPGKCGLQAFAEGENKSTQTATFAAQKHHFLIPLSTILLVILAAFIHASWNLIIKTIPGGISFVWLGALVVSIWMVPVLLIWLWYFPVAWNWAVAGGLLISSALHFVYFAVLQRGYQVSDLSVVYPVARGSAPVIASVAALLLLGESADLSDYLGLLLVTGGILCIAWPGKHIEDKRKIQLGVYYGLSTGFLVAAYTLFDTWLMRSLALAPLVIEAVSHPFRVALLWPHARKNKAEILAIWKEHRLKVVYFALMSPIAFLLILSALKTAPVHFVAPTRELSIVIGVLMADRLLYEPEIGRRLVGSLLMLGGVVLLAV